MDKTLMPEWLEHWIGRLEYIKEGLQGDTEVEFRRFLLANIEDIIAYCEFRKKEAEELRKQNTDGFVLKTTFIKYDVETEDVIKCDPSDPLSSPFIFSCE